jgi:LysR family transcriptional regulator, glycine cleavage system transcriptional activator
MPRRLPPLNAVKAFEAAARNKSFTRAAEELHVTPGAVSRQVKALEATLGLKLFNREHQRLVITEAGRDYLAVVRDALDQIAAGTERLVRRQRSGVLTVSVSLDFAAKWLVNRLGRFAETHPEIDLRIFGNRSPSDVSLEMSNTYWIIHPKVASRIPKIATFRAWLLGEAAEDKRRLEALVS